MPVIAQLAAADEDFVVQRATTRPSEPGQPFTRWSLRKLVAYLRAVHGRVIRIGREALRGLLARRRCREHAGRAQVDPRRPARPRPHLRDPGQPARHKGTDTRRWATKHKVELCFTSAYASWANPIEAHFGPLRQFTIANSGHPNHIVRTRALHARLRWRNANANARRRDVLTAEREERARIRSEKGIRGGGRPLNTAT
ncbi:hypothetical protein GCM10010433_47550 [Streptomyces pulveraceus]